MSLGRNVLRWQTETPTWHADTVQAPQWAHDWPEWDLACARHVVTTATGRHCAVGFETRSVWAGLGEQGGPGHGYTVFDLANDIQLVHRVNDSASVEGYQVLALAEGATHIAFALGNAVHVEAIAPGAPAGWVFPQGLLGAKSVWGALHPDGHLAVAYRTLREPAPRLIRYTWEDGAYWLEE